MTSLGKLVTTMVSIIMWKGRRNFACKHPCTIFNILNVQSTSWKQYIVGLILKWTARDFATYFFRNKILFLSFFCYIPDRFLSFFFLFIYEIFLHSSPFSMTAIVSIHLHLFYFFNCLMFLKLTILFVPFFNLVHLSPDPLH